MQSSSHDSRLLKKSLDQAVRHFQHETEADYIQLTGQKSEIQPRSFDYRSLKLVDNGQLESVIALEGMITHARNCNVTEYQRLTTRFNDLFGCRYVDESNNPLDPAQIGEAIKLSVEAIGLSPDGQLTVYRHFNQRVFHQLESLLQQANGLLKARGVLPGLEVSGRRREDIKTRRCNVRDTTDPEVRAFSSPASLAPPAKSGQQDVFTLLQILMHKDVHKVAMSSPVYDSIEMTDLLFRAIWEDVTVPESIRKLIGRTALTILKASLHDRRFWDDPAHPIRRFLNELAEARPGSGLTEELESDPLYLKARDLIAEFVGNYNDDEQLADDLRKELEEYKQQHTPTVRPQATRTESDSGELCRQRLEEARDCASRKIRERVLDMPIPATLLELLHTHLRDFLVEIILSQGTGGNSWKPVMKTIDLLIWSVQPGKSESDRDRLARLNEKLLSNIEKALRVVKLNTRQIDTLIGAIRNAQESGVGDTISAIPAAYQELPKPQVHSSAGAVAAAASRQPADQRFMQEAANLPVGIWMEFIVDGSHSLRCTLAAKITDPASCIFVNRQGVKVLDKTVADLACELEAGTARQISEDVLVDRAIDTVIARLRARNEEPAVARQDLDSAA